MKRNKRSEEQTEILSSEVNNFERDLHMEDGFSNLLIRSVTLETDAELYTRITAANSIFRKLTDDQTDAAVRWSQYLIDHMWGLICKHNSLYP